MSVLPEGPIVLVGMMATGKSTVGRRLARRTDREFYDSDTMIERSTGHTVAELWAQGGEAAYRGLETDALRQAVRARPAGVVAAAGGVVLAPANRELLDEVSTCDGAVVWLRAGPDVLAARVRPGDHRPLLAEDPAGTLRRLDAERAPLYRQVSDFEVDVDGRSVDEVVGAILALILRPSPATPR